MWGCENAVSADRVANVALLESVWCGLLKQVAYLVIGVKIKTHLGVDTFVLSSSHVTPSSPINNNNNNNEHL